MNEILETINEISISYSPNKKLQKLPNVTNSFQAYTYIYNGFDKNTISIQEEFVVLFLNRRNSPLGIFKLAKGGMSKINMDIRILLSVALKCLASSIVLAHNHPSGSLIPSKEDIGFTRDLKSKCKLVSIELLDHLIVTDDNGKYYSLSDNGEM